MLLEKIKNDRIEALKTGNSKIVKYLSTLYAEASMIGKNSGNRESTDDEIISVIKKFKNNLEETKKALALGGEINSQRISELESENSLYDKYLPSQLTKEELTNIISDVIKTNAIVDLKGMGFIMKYMKEKYSGRFDGRLVNDIARDILKIN